MHWSACIRPECAQTPLPHRKRGTSMVEVSERPILALAERARSLIERLEQAPADPAGGDDPALVRRRLEQWCQVVAKGDWTTFRKRLAWDGLDLDAARRALG